MLHRLFPDLIIATASLRKKHGDMILFMIDPVICHEVMRRRDSAFDGLFFVAVRTTMIYCRPVCAVC